MWGGKNATVLGAVVTWLVSPACFVFPFFELPENVLCVSHVVQPLFFLQVLCAVPSLWHFARRRLLKR